MPLFCSNQSKTKMIIWFYNGFILTRYSYLSEESKKGEEFARNRMLTRLPFGRYLGKWKTVEVYNNVTKELIQKYVDGRRII